MRNRTERNKVTPILIHENEKILFAVALFAGASTAFVACSGSDDEPKPSLDDIKEIKLTVDKNAIEANGEDVVNFTVTSDTGVNLNDKAVILIPGEEITFLDEMYYTSTVNETVTFQARYNGIYSNEVTVEVKNRSKYEKYFRRVLISQLTGTWCVNCPGMTRSLKLVSEQFPDRIEILAMHGSSSQGTDPYAIPQTEKMFSQFPTCGGILRQSSTCARSLWMLPPRRWCVRSTSRCWNIRLHAA